MKLYRYLSDTELNNIKSGNVDKIGSSYLNQDFDIVNSFEYDEEKKYLHFYSNKEDCRFSADLHAGDYRHDYYFCEFKVPTLKALKYRGYGKYDNPKGLGLVKVDEFAIPTDVFSCGYLVSEKLDQYHHEMIKERDREFDIVINYLKAKREKGIEQKQMADD